MIKRFLQTFCFLIFSGVIIYTLWMFRNAAAGYGETVPVWGYKGYTLEAFSETHMAAPTHNHAPLPLIEEEEIVLCPERFDELKEVIRRHGAGVAVFYKDVISGDTFFYNKEQVFPIASIIKAPYAMYVYRLAMERGLCMDERIYTYTQAHHWGGTGRIQHMRVGTTFTLGELLHHAIRYSDNIAMNIMMSVFPREDFTEFAAELGIPHLENVRRITNGRICAECAAVYLRAMHEFIEEGNEFSEIFREHLLNTTNVMIRANYPIARKYGWATDSFHDIGIIYNDRGPYLLVILSDRGCLAGDFPMFTAISRAVERHHNSRFEERLSW